MKWWGYSVVGVDGSPTMIKYAREADPDGEYIVADAASLPFSGASFDLVTAFMSLQDVDDLESAVRENARVIRPGGFLCVAIVHPTSSAGEFDGREPDAPFVISGSYLERRRVGGKPFVRGGMVDDIPQRAPAASGVLRRVDGRRIQDRPTDRSPRRDRCARWTLAAGATLPRPSRPEILTVAGAVTYKLSHAQRKVRAVSNTRWSTAFTLGGLPVRLALVGERWFARVGESVAVGSGALQVLTAALEPVGAARKRALLADLALLAPSIELAMLGRRQNAG